MAYHFYTEKLDVDNLADLIDRLGELIGEAEENWLSVKSLCSEIEVSEMFAHLNQEKAQEFKNISIVGAHFAAWSALETLKEFLESIQQQGEVNESI
ncbi:hypothetical protein [Helicobacter sp. L8]|uniref:hypothetical protein n=1 Tax=Helicobacter sp. L8 TaxID=2316078 RepID=UPI000EB3E818|nr:hypothetical protein [Helicobacter sp. L8]